tara:strand:+ start:32 stop:382 length:351 start_codon:yes stop_codon:yes gene_type:complete
MSVEITIERDIPITEDEWKEAVGKIDSLKLDESDQVGFNPMTKEKIVIKGSDTNVAVYIPSEKEWIRMLSFYGGSGSLPYSPAWENPDDPVRKGVIELASILNAKLYGEGEPLNLP